MGSLTYPAHSTVIQGHLFLDTYRTLLSPFSNFIWCKGESKSQSLGRQSSVLPLSGVSCYTVFVFVRAGALKALDPTLGNILSKS